MLTLTSTTCWDLQSQWQVANAYQGNDEVAHKGRWWFLSSTLNYTRGFLKSSLFFCAQKMSKRSDNHEKMLAEYLDGISGVRAVRSDRGTKYSDIQVSYNNASTWLEIKMHHQDNLANPRVYYQEKTWKTRYFTPLAGFIAGELNKSQVSREFVYSIADYAKMSRETIYIPTVKSEMTANNAVPKSVMRSFCRENETYIIKNDDYDLSSLVTTHYLEGKSEPAHYIQAGDDFFMISNTNPLGLPSDIPELTGRGKFRVRVSNRSKFYEVQGELKITSMLHSKYSILPDSSKINPFCCLQSR